MFLWKKKIKWRGRAVVWRKHHGVGNDVDLDKILENLHNPDHKEQIELCGSDRTIRIIIPWGELIHRCDLSEWADILRLLELSDESQ